MIKTPKIDALKTKNESGEELSRKDLITLESEIFSLLGLSDAGKAVVSSYIRTREATVLSIIVEGLNAASSMKEFAQILKALNEAIHKD